MKQTLLVKHKYKGKFVRAYRIKRRQATVGTTKNSYIHLIGDKAAGLACIFSYEKSGWKILDLGSEPDLKIDHKPFVEHSIDSKCSISVCENTLEVEVLNASRKIFNPKYEGATTGANFTVARWNNRIIAAGYDKSEWSWLPKEVVQLSEYKMTKRKEIEKGKVAVPEDMKKPLKVTFSSIFVFLLLVIGIPRLQSPKEEMPAENVYTRMIFDSKILSEKRQQLQSSGTRLLKGDGGNGEPMVSTKKMAAPETKAVASLRKAGISNMISKIAKQASQNAALIAKLAAMPLAEASVNGQELDALGKIHSTQGQGNKSDMLNSKQGFKIGAIGTAGKGGGSGGYKKGSELGDGGVGTGNIAIDEAESVVEGGLDKETIAKIIREHLGQIRYCYDRQLASDSELHGKVKVKFSIDTEGNVATQSVGESTMNNAMVEECILRRIATWKFPKPRGGTKVLVSYPFLFKSVN